MGFRSGVSEGVWGGGGAERVSDKFSSFFPSGKGRPKQNCFLDLLWFWAVFSESLAFYPSIALFFVPKDPLGSDNKPKQNFIQKLENLSESR